eukprot:5758195-Amphidinium_carterae.6
MSQPIRADYENCVYEGKKESKKSRAGEKTTRIAELGQILYEEDDTDFSTLGATILLCRYSLANCTELRR